MPGRGNKMIRFFEQQYQTITLPVKLNINFLHQPAKHNKVQGAIVVMNEI